MSRRNPYTPLIWLTHDAERAEREGKSRDPLGFAHEGFELETLVNAWQAWDEFNALGKSVPNAVIRVHERIAADLFRTLGKVIDHELVPVLAHPPAALELIRGDRR